MTKWGNIDTKQTLIAYFQIAIGCFIGALAYPTLLIPHHIAPGGFTGLSTVLNYLFNFPVGITSLLMNVPLFIIGYRCMGRIFAFRSLIAAVLFSLLIDLIPINFTITEDPLLASIFGGVLLGIGIGFIIRGGATTGGSDMVAKIMHSKFPHISIGVILFSIDFIVIVLAGVFIEIEYSLYALICIFTCSKMIDLIVMGTSHEKACYIITNKHEQAKQEIMKTLDRGITVIPAFGGYSGDKRPVLLCIVSAHEVISIKSVIYSIDNNAFVFITDAHEVLGEGFKNLGEKN